MAPGSQKPDVHAGHQAWSEAYPRLARVICGAPVRPALSHTPIVYSKSNREDDPARSKLLYIVCRVADPRLRRRRGVGAAGRARQAVGQRAGAAGAGAGAAEPRGGGLAGGGGRRCGGAPGSGGAASGGRPPAAAQAPPHPGGESPLPQSPPQRGRSHGFRRYCVCWMLRQIWPIGPFRWRSWWGCLEKFASADLRAVIAPIR